QTRSIDYPGSVIGVDDSYTFDKFKDQFRVDIIKKDGNDLEFDLVGVDASVANAFRRMMLVNVKTMAIENVYIEGNTSITQDEILAHRLGLIPINVNPYLEHPIDGTDDIFAWKPLLEDEDRMDCNTVVFTLRVKNEQVKSEKRLRGESTETEPYSAKKTLDVMSGDLEWEPQGWQETGFLENPIAPLMDDIIITKLRPGQV
ncbi:DNA-directed RNA polymerase, alpha subunit, N terminal domain-containing protein, partial [Sphaeroforma arctica JP610]